MKVGDTFYVRSRFGASETVKVIKVGRIWAYFDNGKRVKIANRQVFHGSYRAADVLYANRQAYEQEQEVCRAWSLFQSAVRGLANAPVGMTVEKIKEIQKALK